jgi:gamma-glutamyl-gamma-aminobutyrate hydrolase PuuD
VAWVVGSAPWVTSLHHQGVERPGAGWRVTARAEDGTAEAMEWVGHDQDQEPWDALAVQWHPELDDPTGPALFSWLVAASRGPELSRRAPDNFRSDLRV